MANKWIQHVKEFASKNNISYGCALTMPECKESYRKNVSKPKATAKPKTVQDIINIAVKLLAKRDIELSESSMKNLEKSSTPEKVIKKMLKSVEMNKDDPDFVEFGKEFKVAVGFSNPKREADELKMMMVEDVNVAEPKKPKGKKGANANAKKVLEDEYLMRYIKEFNFPDIIYKMPDDKLKTLIRVAWKKITQGNVISGWNKKQLNELTGVEFLELFNRNKDKNGKDIWNFDIWFNPNKLMEYIKEEINKRGKPKTKKKTGEKLSAPFEDFSIGEEVLIKRGGMKILGKIVNQTDTGISVKLDDFDEGRRDYRGYTPLYFKKTFTGDNIRVSNEQMKWEEWKRDLKKLPDDFDYTSYYPPMDFNA